jgi:hypothetical protein
MMHSHTNNPKTSAARSWTSSKAYLLYATRAALETPGTVTLPQALLTS